MEEKSWKYSKKQTGFIDNFDDEIIFNILGWIERFKMNEEKVKIPSYILEKRNEIEKKMV